MEELKLSDTGIDKLSDINIDFKKLPLDLGSSILFTKEDFDSSPTYYSKIYQDLFDTAIYNNLDMISNNKSFHIIKNYEEEFNESSENFYKRWIKGEINPTPKIHVWMNLYQELFRN